MDSEAVDTSQGTVKLYKEKKYKLSTTDDARGVDFMPEPRSLGIILVINHPAKTERDFAQWLGRAGRHMTKCIRFVMNNLNTK